MAQWNERPVCVVNSVTGDVEERYFSASEAAMVYGTQRTNVAQSAAKHRFPRRNYVFRYADDFDSREPYPPTFKPVLFVSKETGRAIGATVSIESAARAIGADNEAVKRSVKVQRTVDFHGVPVKLVMPRHMGMVDASGRITA